jgi:hypothetical protein
MAEDIAGAQDEIARIDRAGDGAGPPTEGGVAAGSKARLAGLLDQLEGHLAAAARLWSKDAAAEGAELNGASPVERMMAQAFLAAVEAASAEERQAASAADGGPSSPPPRQGTSPAR